MKQEKKQRSMSAVASLLLLAVFAISILGVLLVGARAYQRLTRQGNESYDSRTCCAYVASRFRQASGSARLEAFGDGDCLAFYEELGGNTYVTRVYSYNGWLMELFCSAAGDFAPADGEKILPIGALELTQQDGLVIATVADANGATQTLKLQSPVEVTP